MILKIMSLFLIGMMVLAMFGKLRMPRIGLKKSAKCDKCGRYRIGKGPCSCERQG
ncbi:MAG: hypothetical protein JXR14_13510 [Paracoccaceae bacterium]